MFGWFSCASIHACLPSASRHRRWLRTAPTRLAAQLPSLGTVLYLPSAAALCDAHTSLPGWVAERIELAPLLRCCWIAAISEVGAEGPREWIECFDPHGAWLARVYLLPDTDYLAWDALLGTAVALNTAPRLRMLQPMRCAMAAPLQFRQRRLGGLMLLGADESTELSALGQGVANDVAREVGVPVF